MLFLQKRINFDAKDGENEADKNKNIIISISLITKIYI